MAHQNGATLTPAQLTAEAEQLAAAPLPLSIRRKITADQLVEWKYALYNVGVSIKVARSIGDPDERIEQLRKEAERCQRGLDAAAGLLAELSAEGAEHG